MSKLPFYTDIAVFYDEIFPLNQGMVNFVLKVAGDSGQKHFLDVGCGSGTLVYALQDYFASLNGLEPDSAMLELAKNKLGADCSHVCFSQSGMLDLAEFAREKRFDVVTIVGNTLVHLENLAQVNDCFCQVRSILNEGGIFIFQIINYERIFRTGEFFLPTIETKNCLFERLYEKQYGSEQLIFHTRLHIRASGQVLENRVPLYPLRLSELSRGLSEAGFTDINYYGSFAGVAFEDDSVPLVGIARLP